MLIVYASLYPADFHFRLVDGGPLWFLLHRWDSWLNIYLVRDIPVNIAIYIPFGLFGLLARAESREGLLTWRDYLAPVALAFLLSIAVELAQIYEPSRSSSAVDVLCNTGGAILGMAAAAVLRKTSGRIKLKLPVIAPLWAWVFLAILSLAGLWPLQFTAVTNSFSLVPFGPLMMDGPTGMMLLAEHFGAAVAAILLLRASGKTLGAATGIVATAALAIECAGIFMPGQTPGITNPVLALLAGYALGATGGNASKR